MECCVGLWVFSFTAFGLTPRGRPTVPLLNRQTLRRVRLRFLRRSLHRRALRDGLPHCCAYVPDCGTLPAHALHNLVPNARHQDLLSLRHAIAPLTYGHAKGRLHGTAAARCLKMREPGAVRSYRSNASRPFASESLAIAELIAAIA